MGAKGAKVSLNGRKGGKSSQDRTTRNSSDKRSASRRVASHKMRHVKREKEDGGKEVDGHIRDEVAATS